MPSYRKKIIEKYQLAPEDLDRIIQMAWEDRTSFDAISRQFGLKEEEIIQVMRNEMKLSSWKMWRERVQGRATKHEAKRPEAVERFKCSRQKGISLNKYRK